MAGKDFLDRERQMSARSYAGNERQYLEEVLTSGNLSSLSGGKFVPRLEEAFAVAIGARHAVAMNSCMAALHAGVMCAGAGAGDEVVCDSEFVFGAMAVLYANAIPTFVDIDPVTHNMDPDKLEGAITEKTKAVIVTHAWGLPAEMDRILAVARRHKLLVIEDCAESILAAYKGRCTGSWGDVGCFSLQASKQLSVGDGGMATTNDPELCKGLGRHAGAPTFQSVAYGLDYNYRMNEPTAAIALAQLETLPAAIAQLRKHATYYDQAVAGCPWLQLQRGPEDAEHTFYHWAATFRGEEHGIPLKDFSAAVAEARLSSITVGYTKIPAYRHPVIRDRLAHAFSCAANRRSAELYPDGLCPVAEHVIPRIVIGYLTEPEETAKQEADKLFRVVERIGRG
ncbi:MAG: DegT/DnrJ/EryC1/StrS family aminotransferase [Armatimonadetes bacterium]|nr:DegT/DnrJ/EryC1/StrS family aminotransferase [Armatimonadota bacterium]